MIKNGTRRRLNKSQNRRIRHIEEQHEQTIERTGNSIENIETSEYQLLEKKKKEYYEEMIDNNRNNPSEMWKTLKEIIRGKMEKNIK